MGTKLPFCLCGLVVEQQTCNSPELWFKNHDICRSWVQFPPGASKILSYLILNS